MISAIQKPLFKFHMSSASNISFLSSLFRSAISILFYSVVYSRHPSLLQKKRASTTLNFSFFFLMFKNLFNCKSHTPEQQAKETCQVNSQISSKPFHASSISFHLLNLQHLTEDKTNIPKQ